MSPLPPPFSLQVLPTPGTCSCPQLCCLTDRGISPFAKTMSGITLCFILQWINKEICFLSCRKIPEPCCSGAVYCLACTGKLKAPVIAQFLLFNLLVALETAQFILKTASGTSVANLWEHLCRTTLSHTSLGHVLSMLSPFYVLTMTYFTSSTSKLAALLHPVSFHTCLSLWLGEAPGLPDVTTANSATWGDAYKISGHRLSRNLRRRRTCAGGGWWN